MSFLTPLYLLGIAAAALPIAFHFLRRTPSGKVPFSSLMFLKPSPPRMTRRSRLQHWPLLLLRVLVLCLLGFAFARPFLRNTSALELDQPNFDRVLVLLDTSASMKRGDLWNQAKEELATLVDSLGSADQLAVWSFDERIQEVMGFSDWLNNGSRAGARLLADRVSKLSPTWHRTKLGAALLAAADEVDRIESEAQESTRAERRRIVLISDLQHGSDVRDLQGYEWPEHVRLSIFPVTAQQTTNASAQLLTDLAEEEDAGETIRVLVSNSADASHEKFLLEWTDVPQPDNTKPHQVYVPPGQSRAVHLRLPESQNDRNRLVLRGDDHEFDNVLYVQTPKPVEQQVLFLGDADPKDVSGPRYFIERAFPNTPRRRVEVVSAEAGELLLVANRQAPLAIAAELQKSHLDGLRLFLQAGGNAVIVAPAPDDVAVLRELIGSEKIDIADAPVEEYAMLGWIDFQHPVFAPFADPRFSDFTKIHFWNYRKITCDEVPDAKIVARFDTQDPALVDFPVAAGRVMLFASGWSPSDSQLALSSKFVPLMNRLLDWSSDQTQQTQYFVGDTIPVHFTQEEEKIEVTLPGGKTQAVSSGKAFAATNEVGVYGFAAGDSQWSVAVNLPPAESDTTPMAFEDLESLGVKLQADQQRQSPAQAEAERRQLLAGELESKQKLWRWLVAAALLVLAWESWLAHRWSPRENSEGEHHGSTH